MSAKELLFSEEQMDFLAEMMNIGAGNAATAFAQVLKCDVNMEIPVVKALSVEKVGPILSDSSAPVLCSKMGLVGDVAGNVFFIVPNEEMESLTHLMQQAFPSQNADLGESNDQDLSIAAEIGNILTGVYLTTIHDFCKLDIYHSVPVIAVDMIQSLLDESIVLLSRQVQAILLIENKFIVGEKRIKTYLLLIPALQSIDVFVHSIEQAKKVMWGEAENG